MHVMSTGLVIRKDACRPCSVTPVLLRWSGTALQTLTEEAILGATACISPVQSLSVNAPVQPPPPLDFARHEFCLLQRGATLHNADGTLRILKNKNRKKVLDS